MAITKQGSFFGVIKIRKDETILVNLGLKIINYVMLHQQKISNKVRHLNSLFLLLKAYIKSLNIQNMLK